jgi:hypothetical protein
MPDARTKRAGIWYKAMEYGYDDAGAGTRPMTLHSDCTSNPYNV